jgi:hypothetical protein
MKKILVLMVLIGFALILQGCAVYPHGHSGGYNGYGSPYYGNYGGGHHGGHGWHGGRNWNGGGNGWGGHHGWGRHHGHHDDD